MKMPSGHCCRPASLASSSREENPHFGFGLVNGLLLLSKLAWCSHPLRIHFQAGRHCVWHWITKSTWQARRIPWHIRICLPTSTGDSRGSQSVATVISQPNTYSAERVSSFVCTSVRIGPSARSPLSGGAGGRETRLFIENRNRVKLLPSVPPAHSYPGTCSATESNIIAMYSMLRILQGRSIRLSVWKKTIETKNCHQCDQCDQ